MKKPLEPGTENSTPQHHIEAKEHLWNRHGLDDVYFQRDTFVTYLSILGGVSVGVLLTQFLPLIEQLKLSRWHLILYFVASLLLMISTWVMVSWLALTLKMQLRFHIVIPQFIQQFSLCVICLLVTNPAGWLAASSAFLFFTLISNLIYFKTGQWDDWPLNVNKATSINQWVYLFWMLLALAASIHLHFFPSNTNEMIWGIVALAGSILTIIKQHNDIEAERKTFRIP
ncbi:MAG TPA: hypothetical protein PKK59_06360 [Anaerolineaceae bacterium]|nr:hypothetical protein [Anaerolineaceae bacterium]